VRLAEDGGVTGLQDGMIGKKGDQLELSGGNERGEQQHDGGEAG
jgi:hypothetical protein